MAHKEVIAQLGLIQHIEGGFFKETYRCPVTANGRSLMTVIYYLLSRDSAIDHWHMNKSDIMHFHLQGGSIRYLVLHPDNGRLEFYTLGQNISKGEVMQLLVPGGTWKACYLLEGDYGLISQAVSPGFEYEDMKLGKEEELQAQFPQHKEVIWQLQSLKQAKKQQQQKQKLSEKTEDSK